ncbi:NUMOD4 domain-containing protein [[Ruminococcus] lactaris]|jgi:hypothetical protein|nr:NUMOD4 domain-containing protein [[Ruminococcus] lactaris]DAX06887.1 MAG TPA: homing endonuclease [Bacteriophage sp.]
MEQRRKKIKCEIWKDIPEYKGFYQASNLGNIRSLDRKISKIGNGGVNVTSFMKGRVLAQRIQNGGYPIVSISVNAKRKICTVHRLVASAFLDNPEKFRDVNHKDGNKRNNYVENLEWTSHGENIKHSYNVLKQARNCKPIKCVDTGVVYSSCKEASDLTGINVGSINHVITGIAKTAGGMRWERV